MLRIIALLSFVFTANATLFSQYESCQRTTQFGQAEICLPHIDGYQECYLDPKVKSIADASEVDINSILGFYLNDNTYARRDSLGYFSYDDYFKVYATKEIKDLEADQAMLLEMQELLGNNYFRKNWGTVMDEIDKSGIDIDIGIPTVIKTYNLNEDSFTMIMITKYDQEGSTYTLIAALNGLLISKRLIWMAYYLTFDGEESIVKVQENSNRIMHRMFSVK